MRLAFWRQRPDGRLLFRFHDGTRFRCVDPTVVGEALEADLGPGCGRDLLRTLATVASSIPGVVDTSGHQAAQTAAAAKIAEVVGKAFGVEDFEEGPPQSGLTRGEKVTLLCAYLDYLGGLAAAARPTTR